MSDGNNMRGRKSVAIVTVMLMLMMVVQVPLSDASDVSLAASGGTPSVGNLNVTAFDQDSTDYSSLAYLSDELPRQLNAAEWARDGATGLWYNVSSTGTNYGKTLKYGMITGISVSEIRSDIVSFFPSVPFTVSSFTVLQADYSQNESCNITLNVSKDGSVVYDDMSAMSMDRGGFRIVSSIQQAVPLSVANSANADINVTDTKGSYSVSLMYDGISSGSKSITYGGIAYALSGKVVDANGDNVPNAEVKYVVYSDDSTSASIVASGSKFTDASGSYTIFAKQGEVAQVTEIVFSGLNFPNQVYSYGSVSGNVSPGPVFTAREHVVIVTANDSSGRPAIDAPIKAVWYTCVLEGTSYTKFVSENGIFDDVPTDSNGIAYITVDASQMPQNAKLYVSGDIGNYTFTCDPEVSTGNTTHPLPDPLVKKGNVYVNTTTYADVSITADELSLEVTVSGGKDAMSQGGAVLQDVEVDADWYYQMNHPSTGYCVRDGDDQLEPGSFTGLIRGTAWLPNKFTDVDGKVIVCYTLPQWTVSVSNGEGAYLYIHAVGGASSSFSAAYTFNSTVPADGSKSLTDLDSDYVSAVSAPYGSMPSTVNVYSNDVAYSLSGTITGTVPEKVTVYCMYGSVGRSIEAYDVGGTISFTFAVKAGTSNIIEINPVDGYVFSNPRQSMPTADSNQAFTSTSAASAPLLDRGTPVTIGKYVIGNLEVGDMVDVRYSVAGVDCSMTRVSDSATLNIDIKGWVGNVATGFIATGTGLYIGAFSYDSGSDSYIADSAKVVERKYVTYYDASSNAPSIDNVVGMQSLQISCDGELYSSVITDQKGVVSTQVPDVSTLTYSFGNLSVTAEPITGGAYDGYYAVNLKDVIAPVGPKQVNVTVRYIATSSLQNSELPTNIDVLNGPMPMVLDVGSTQTLEAPDMEGFVFSGWYLNGESISDQRNAYVCSFSVTDDLEGVEITASYSAETPEPPKEDIGTIVAIGMVSVTIALIALIYVILQIRRY